MRACSGTWIAHGGGSADRDTADRNGRLRVPPGEESYFLRRVWLSAEEALVVNPYDLDEASSALAAALTMSPDEQRVRMRSMRAFVSEFNVYRWAGRMLVHAARLRRRERLTGRLSDRALAAPEVAG
jgi:hypothetical protein